MNVLIVEIIGVNWDEMVVAVSCFTVYIMDNNSKNRRKVIGKEDIGLAEIEVPLAGTRLWPVCRWRDGEYPILPGVVSFYLANANPHELPTGEPIPVELEGYVAELFEDLLRREPDKKAIGSAIIRRALQLMGRNAASTV